MATKVTIPKLGLTMTEGTIVEWKKREGEEVEKGEILYVIETEKVTFEVEAPVSGILGKIVAKEGDVVPVGGVVAYILEVGEKISEIPGLVAEKEQEKPPAEVEMVMAEVKISPVARRIAQEHNIDVSAVKGTGPGSTMEESSE